MFVRRPKPGDNEDDLLKFQKEFLTSGQQPSAKLVKCSSKSNADAAVKLSQSSKTTNSNTECKAPKTKPSYNVEEEINRYDTHITTVLSNIIKERQSKTLPSFPVARNVANPQALSCNFKKSQIDKKRKKKSLFSQQFVKSKTQISNESDVHTAYYNDSTNPQSLSRKDLEHIFPSSRIVTGDGLKAPNKHADGSVQSIHQENIIKLSQMSSKDVVEEQMKLKENLDSKILEFLTRKKTKVETSTKMRSQSDQEVCSNMEIETPQESLPLSTIEVRKDWVNMDKVEIEKIDWTKNIPENATNELDFPHRFDFDGCLLSVEASLSIPSYFGLHHHGSEAKSAGYTLEELISLARSQFVQQQVLSLRILAKVLNKDKKGDYYSVLNRFLTPVLIEAGFAFILRWALDSRSDNCIQASVDALHALFQPCIFQQHYLDQHLLSYRGCEFPSFCPSDSSENSKTKENDHELVSRDLVKGFLQMDILLRLRYIIEVCQPDRSTICKCLEIIQRICQHSMESSVKVLDCPRLLQVVTETFLPIVWPSDCAGDQEKLCKWPMTQAVRLIRVMCQGGRHVASRVIHDYPRVRDFITKTIIYEQDQSNEDLHFLKLETWRLWTVLVSYGFCIEVCRDMWPELMRSIQGFVEVLWKNSIEIEQVEMSIKFISCAVKSPCVPDEASQVFLNNEEVKGFSSIAITVAQQAIVVLSEAQFNIHEDKLFGIISGCLSIVTSYIERRVNNDVGEVLSIIKSLHPFVISSISILQEAELSSSLEVCSALPDLKLNTLSNNVGKRILSRLSRFNFLTSFFRCSVQVCKANKSICRNYLPLLSDWCQADSENLIMSNLKSGFFHRAAHHSIYHLTQLFTVCVTNEPDLKAKCSKYFHLLTLSCLGTLGSGDEELVTHLICKVLFHPDLWSDVATIEIGSEQHPVTKFLSGLLSTFSFLISFNSKQLETSRNWAHQNQLQITSFLLPPDSGPILPLDWPFLPIIYIYDSAIHRGEAVDTSSVNRALAAIRTCLNFLLFLEVNRSEFWSRLNITTKIMRLMCLYMAGSDVFLDSEVAVLMKILFSSYCSSSRATEIDFNQTLPGVSSFYDFYVSLLEQYEGVSYGDPLFSAVVLLPLANTTNSSLKLALWAEHTEALRVISLTEDQLLSPPVAYLTVVESDCDVIRAYVRALIGGSTSSSCLRSSFLHKLALHHVALYLSNQNTPDKFRTEVMSVITNCKAELRDQIMNYVS